MEFEFSRLAEVDELPRVGSGTQVLVVDNDDVWRAENLQIGAGSYIDYLEQYITWSSGLQTDNTPIDYIKSRTVDIDNKPIDGFIIITNQGNNSESYIFTISGTAENPKQTIRKYYEEVNNGTTTRYVQFLEFSSGNKLLDKLDTVNSETSNINLNINSLEVQNHAEIGDYVDVGGDTTIGGSLEVESDSELHGNLGVSGNTTLNGNLSVSGNENISGNETVTGTLTAYGNTVIGGNLYLGNTKHITVTDGQQSQSETRIDGNSIKLSYDKNYDNGVTLEQDNNGNLYFHRNSNYVKISGVDDPTNNNEAANKHYVDSTIINNNSSVENRLNNLFTSLGSDPLTPYTIIANDDLIYLNRTTPTNINRIYEIDVSSIAPNLDRFKLLGVWTSLLDQQQDEQVGIYDGYYRLLTSTQCNYTYNNVSNKVKVYVNLLNVYPNTQEGDYIVGNIKVVYALPTSYPESAEIADLRVPFDYTGIIEDYDSGTTYHLGDYVFYPDSTDGLLYYCTTETSSSTWDNDEWALATARHSIEDAVDNKLKKDGTDLWESGNLNMNSSSSAQHKIVNLGTPTNPSDAVTKSYVDNKGFTLDSNGILNFG